MSTSAFGPERPVASRLATAGARQAVRACALRPTLAGGHRGLPTSPHQHRFFVSPPGRPPMGPAIAHPNHLPRCNRARRRNAPRAQPGRALAEPPSVAGDSWSHTIDVSAKPLAGRTRRVSGAPRSTGLVALARSATRLLTRRACLSRVSAANAASSRRGPQDRAPQGSRSEAQTAPATRRGLPARGFAAPADARTDGAPRTSAKGRKLPIAVPVSVHAQSADCPLTPDRANGVNAARRWGLIPTRSARRCLRGPAPGAWVYRFRDSHRRRSPGCSAPPRVRARRLRSAGR